MQVNTNKYTIIFMVILTVVMALLLALAAEGLKERQEFNVAFANKEAILKSVNIVDRERVLEIYENQVEEIVVDYEGNEITEDEDGEPIQASLIDHRREVRRPLEEQRLPLYRFNDEDGSTYYIIPVRGSGLWNEIWGYIAFESDLNTIYGASFDHAAETPGLGAEIATSWFQDQFQGKKIFDEQGNFVSVYVRKGGARDDKHEVDGIAGSTVTADGVTDMLEQGLQKYLPFFDKIREEPI